MATPFNNVDAIGIREIIDKYMKIITKCVKNMPPNPVIESLKSLVTGFKDNIPVVTALRNKNLKEHHWIEIK
jgi:dynein heavy chain